MESERKEAEPLARAGRAGWDRFVTTAESLRKVSALGWIVFAVWLVVRFEDPIRNKLLPGVNAVEAFGFKIGFADARKELQKAVNKQQPGRGAVGATITDNEVQQVVQRAKFLAPVVEGAHILGVDPKPANNVYEQNVLRSFGVFVDLAESTSTAMELAAVASYDAVISNMERQGESAEPAADGKSLPAGLVLLRRLRESGNTAPLIFYIMHLDPSRGTPAGAFAITNRPDHLLHSVMDVLERRRSFPEGGPAVAEK